ncbi:MAG: tetratricopeptide repeat protein, partial [Gemmatimonas sp.]
MSDAWRAFNAEGLALAHQGRWVDATRVFEEALAVFDVPDVEGRVTSVAKDDARARLMLNIGQCQFHLGAFEESRRFAERSCALRVSLYGEESLVVARTRGDLAVILGASGHTDEAMSLLERAVLAVERKRGDESAHLLPLLTNAARLLARSAPDRARPYISRLKALLFAQKLGRDAEIFQPSELPGYSFAPSPQSSAGDDHLLRRAIAQTVDLLRSTPSTNLAMPGSPPPLPDDVVVTQEQLGHVIPAPQPQRDASVDVVWEYEVPPPVEPPTSSSANVVVGGIDDTVFDLVEPPPPTLNTIPVATAITDKANANPLGFEVQYGIPSQLHESFDNPTVPLP